MNELAKKEIKKFISLRESQLEGSILGLVEILIRREIHDLYIELDKLNG